MKTCSKCKQEKELECFSKCKKNKDGLFGRCKECDRQYYQLNKQRIDDRCNKRARDPVEKEKKKAYDNKHYPQYYQRNKQQIETKNEKWKINNKDKRSEIDKKSRRKRRALKLEVNECYTHEDEQLTRQAFNHRCFNCGETDNLHIDHFHPLSKGNALILQNACLLCGSCNSSKGAREPIEFYEPWKYIEAIELMTKSLILKNEKK